eukprot:3433988-Amphidinium_carterae.1
MFVCARSCSMASNKSETRWLCLPFRMVQNRLDCVHCAESSEHLVQTSLCVTACKACALSFRDSTNQALLDNMQYTVVEFCACLPKSLPSKTFEVCREPLWWP